MWSIHVVSNTAKIPKACAAELFALQDESGEGVWYSPDEVTYKGQLQFNSDHYEHMDFLGYNERYTDVLKKHNVEGDICFADLEQGGPGGSFWGYRFDGQGGMQKLSGSVVWEPTEK